MIEMPTVKEFTEEAFAYFFCELKKLEKVFLQNKPVRNNTSLYNTNSNGSVTVEQQQKFEAAQQKYSDLVSAVTTIRTQMQMVGQDADSKKMNLAHERTVSQFQQQLQMVQEHGVKPTSFQKIQEVEFEKFDQLMLKVNRQLNTLSDRSVNLKQLSEVDQMLKLLKDYSLILLQIKTRISPQGIERSQVTDIDTKDLIQFNQAIERRSQFTQLKTQAFGEQNKQQQSNLPPQIPRLTQIQSYKPAKKVEKANQSQQRLNHDLSRRSLRQSQNSSKTRHDSKQR